MGIVRTHTRALNGVLYTLPQPILHDTHTHTPTHFFSSLVLVSVRPPHPPIISYSLTFSLYFLTPRRNLLQKFLNFMMHVSAPSWLHVHNNSFLCTDMTILLKFKVQ